MGNIGSLVPVGTAELAGPEGEVESFGSDLLFSLEPHEQSSATDPETYSGDTVPLNSLSESPNADNHGLLVHDSMYVATIDQRFARDFRRLMSILEKDPDMPGLVIFGHCSGYTEADHLQVGDRVMIHVTSIEGGKTYHIDDQVIIMDKRYLEDQVDNVINNVYSTVASLLTSSYLPEDLKDNIAENSSHLTFFRQAMEGEDLKVPVAFVVKKC